MMVSCYVLKRTALCSSSFSLAGLIAFVCTRLIACGRHKVLHGLLAASWFAFAPNCTLPAVADCGTGVLAGPVELRDGQTGFAGLSGHVWTIDCLGNVSVARFLNERNDTPHGTGGLSMQALREIASAFEEQGFAQMRESLGPSVQVNPRVLILRYGQKTVVLRWPPGDRTALETFTVLGEQETRFVSLAQSIHRLAAQSIQ
jgi:hypothetical protein